MRDMSLEKEAGERRGRGGGARKVVSFQKKGFKTSPSFRFVQSFSLVQ
jgi:hypothetical protein